MKQLHSNRVIIKIAALLTFGIISCTPDEKQIDLKSEIKTHVAYLASDSLEGRGTGSSGEKMAVEYIEGYFKKLHLQPKGTSGYLQKFYLSQPDNPHEQPEGPSSENDTTGTAVTNVIAFLDNPGENIIVVGAHHDHLGYGDIGSLHRGDTAIHNGADDNASGVAVVMALAHELKNMQLNDDVLFITFSGEEHGLWGSNYFVKHPTIDLEKVKAMINLDMVGRLNEDKTIVAHGTGTSPVWPGLLKQNNTDSLDIVMKPSGVGPSDHTSFYLQDLPVLHLFTGQHEDYHKPGDDAEKLNYAGTVMITHFLENIITDLSTEENVAFTKTKEDTNKTPRFTVTLGVVPDYLFSGEGMRIDGVTEGKTAAKAGIEKGDIVVAMGDSTVTDMQSYMRALSAFKKGDTTTVTVKRDDDTKSMKVEF